MRDLIPVPRIELKVACLDLTEESSLVMVVEWRIPCEDYEDYHSSAPHVHRLPKKSFAEKKGTHLG